MSGWFFTKWLFFGTGSLFHGHVWVRLIDSSLFGILVAYTQGVRFAQYSWRKCWIVKAFKKK
jgi:hypothetical protein